MQTMKCDKCNYIQPVDMRINKLEHGIERLYIECNNCKEQTTCYYTNDNIRRLQAEQRIILSKPTTKKWDKRIKTNKKAIKKEMDRLRNQIDTPGVKGIDQK